MIIDGSKLMEKLNIFKIKKKRVQIKNSNILYLTESDFKHAY
jgi:hypothetical protein